MYSEVTLLSAYNRLAGKESVRGERRGGKEGVLAS